MKNAWGILFVVAGAWLASTEATAGSARPTPPKSGKIPVAFVITDMATVIDFAGPWEVFQDVTIDGRGNSDDDEAPFQLYTVGASRAPVNATAGLKIVPDYTFDDAPAPRVVVVGAQRGAPKLSEWLKRVAAAPGTDVMMSVCTGAFRLADAGLLDGKPATTHHDFYEPFANRFPRVKLERGLRFVRSDARTFAAGGLTSGIDLALHVVALYFGEAVANQTATYMEYQSTGWRQGKIAGAPPSGHSGR